MQIVLFYVVKLQIKAPEKCTNIFEDSMKKSETEDSH